MVHALATEEQARQLIAQVLFAHPGVCPLHALQESQLWIQANALRNISPFDAIADVVGGLHGGAVLRVFGVGDGLEEGGLAAAIRAGDAQVLGAAENQVFWAFRRGSLLVLVAGFGGRKMQIINLGRLLNGKCFT